MLRLAKHFAILAAVGALAIPAIADFSGTPMPVQLTRVAGYYWQSGGEFTLNPGATLRGAVTSGLHSDFIDGSWQAFCVERNEYVAVPGSYYGDINRFATYGGISGQDGFEGPGGTQSDSLDPRTAYLYQNFRLGTLDTSYDYSGAGRAADAGALQQAIWYIENESTSLSGKAVTFYNEAVEAAENGTRYDGSATDGEQTWAGIGNVRILNMWGDTLRNYWKQDQLVMTPVPVPAAGVLGVIGLAAVAWIKRQGS